MIFVQYIVHTSSFNCGRTRISLRIQIGPIDLLSNDLICTSGLLNSARRKEVARAAPNRVQAVARLHFPGLSAWATNALPLLPQMYPFRWQVGHHLHWATSTLVERQHQRQSSVQR